MNFNIRSTLKKFFVTILSVMLLSNYAFPCFAADESVTTEEITIEETREKIIEETREEIIEEVREKIKEETREEIIEEVREKLIEEVMRKIGSRYSGRYVKTGDSMFAVQSLAATIVTGLGLVIIRRKFNKSYNK